MIELAFVLLLVVWVPVRARLQYRRFQQAVAEGRPDVRVREYRRAIRNQWILAAGVLGLWWWRGRDLSGLGLAWPGTWQAWLALLLSLVAIGFLWDQLRRVRTQADLRDTVDAQLSGVRDLLPTTPGEYSVFAALGVTAGICEELIYRGFLIAWFALWLPLWAAVFVAAAVFGLAHLYQGAGGVAKTGVVGLVMGGLYVLGGSLLPPILLHAAIDVINGRVGYEVLASGRSELRPDSTSTR